ncbi:Rne/Rng family ribonuclease [Arthrobacter sp. JZ12]|uniref:Rne/Rng family ribonuclease n=1 Tax=Arthrobacter sp. JZ12 TaxID=2654190 RepID=UPI002B4A4FBD|nr:Rne/Rng family ribonuclease [Arthrobacter sp. JZ12]WRH24788.1 Rne/Rng family ribonuclease [Arthrobacter sp. JZ12]
MDINASDSAEVLTSGAPQEAPAQDSGQEAPARKPVRTRRRKADDAAASDLVPSPVISEAAAPAATGEAEAQEESGTLVQKPVRARRTRKTNVEGTEAVTAAEPAAVDGDAAGAAVARTDENAGTAAEAAADASATADAGTGAGTDAVAAAPTRRRRARKADAAPEAPEAAETTEATEAAQIPEAAQPEAAEGSADEDTPARTRRTRSSRSRSNKAAVPADAAPAEPLSVEPVGTAEPAQENEEAVRTTGSGGVEAEATAAEMSGTDEVPETDAADEAGKTAAASAQVPEPFTVPDSPVSLLFHAPDLTAVVPRAATKAAPVEDDTEDSDGDEESRGRRRSRRNRNRNRSGEGEGTESESKPQSSESPDEGESVTSRRRRRRRRGDEDLELTGGQDDDPPNTVTRVRAPRQSQEAVSDRVTSVKGSTRLEAKKQRRRESRDSGRRRHVITEAEFLARRESVDRQMVVRQRDDRIQIAVMEDGVLAEHFVSKTQQDSLIGNVYLGKVQNVLPSMEAAFIDIGRGRNAVLYAGEVNWDAAGLDGQPRRIELALKSGDSVLVQVTKDPVGHKGARLTSQISLPGRYLVYVPGGSMTGISRKLPDVERNRLKRILKDRLPENAGVIVRTAAEGASEEELTHDINRLRSQWEAIEGKAASTKTLAPELLYGEPDLTIKVVRDVFNEDFSKLIVSGEEAWDTIEAYVMYVAPDLVGRLEKWTVDEDIFAARRIDEQIHKALERKVFLPSGGSLVIDRTEAMTVVDVNTGKFTGSGGNLEETVTKNNLEAAEEVVRQLRLRDIGGIIVIDFIDMVLEANRDLVLRRLVECLGRDRTKHQVAEVTSLGLVQMTRKRMGTGLLEVFGENCEHCGGRGVVTHDEPVEHRRHAVSPDNHQQHLRQEKISRSERKRRARNQQQEEQAPAPEQKSDDAERQARAEAARAALANIAAATHAAHEHEDHPVEPAASSAAVLTINGEKVSLPRGESVPAPVREEPRLTLESLTEAFNRFPSAAQDDASATASVEPGEPVEPAAEVEKEQARPTQQPVQGEPEAPSSSRRKRRHRAASSAQGSAATSTIERAAEAEVQHAAGTQHVARAHTPAPKPQTTEEPTILGVGVPASEL